MEMELTTLYNVLQSYKEALMKILDKIDQCMLQTLTTYENTPLSIAKKYHISLEMVGVVQNYIKMLYTGESIVEELILKLSEVERNTQPERQRRQSNPFRTLDSESSVRIPLFFPHIKPEADAEFPFLNIELESRENNFPTAHTEVDDASTVVDVSVHNDQADSSTQTENNLCVALEKGTSECVEKPEIKITNIDNPQLKGEITLAGHLLHESGIDAVADAPKLPKQEMKAEETRIETEIQGEGALKDSQTPHDKTESQKVSLDSKDPALEDDTREPNSFPEPEPAKETTQPENQVKREKVSFALCPTRQKLGVSPLCHAEEPQQPTVFQPDWRQQVEKCFENKNARKSFKWKRGSPVKNPSAARDSDRKSKQNRPVFDILDDELKVGQLCCFCYIQSPSEFYVRKDQDIFERLETHLNEDINDQSHYVVNKYKSKEEAKINLGNFCFGFVPAKRKWFRLEVLDWMAHEPEAVYVQMIDYGEKHCCSYSNLKAMVEFYAQFPRMAIKCHLACVGSTCWQDPTKWSHEAIDCLVELSEIKNMTMLETIFVQKEGSSYAVDLINRNDRDANSVGEMLVHRGCARQFNVSTDDLLSSIEEEDLESLSNINEAVAGYDAKDEARICPFTDNTGTKCFKGPACKLEHGRLASDGFTTDQVMVAKTTSPLPLPHPGIYIKILITYCKNSCHFYAHIITNKTDSSLYNADFERLRDTMSANNIVQSYEKFKVYPGIGELVLTRFASEWVRGKCVSYEQNETVSIFLIDFGCVITKKMCDLRRMKDDFLYVPEQAVECILNRTKQKENAPIEQVREFVSKYMYQQFFAAVILDNNRPLRLQMWDQQNNDMEGVIINYGLGRQREDIIPAVSSIFYCE